MGTSKDTNESVLRFSQAVGSASDTSNDKVLHQTINPIARQSDFMEKGCLKEKTTLPEAPTCIAEFLYVTVRYPRPGWRISTPFPFKQSISFFPLRLTGGSEAREQYTAQKRERAT